MKKIWSNYWFFWMACQGFMHRILNSPNSIPITFTWRLLSRDLQIKTGLPFNYRNQWPEIAHGFQTYSVSFDKYLEKFRSGLGVSCYSRMWPDRDG